MGVAAEKVASGAFGRNVTRHNNSLFAITVKNAVARPVRIITFVRGRLDQETLFTNSGNAVCMMIQQTHRPAAETADNIALRRAFDTDVPGGNIAFNFPAC